MGYLHRCLMCGEKIDSGLLECPCCGEKQYGENNEYYPDKRSMKVAKAVLQGKQLTKPDGFLNRIFGGKRKKKPMFSEEECFIYGIHPNDETYRKTMELDILSKNYKE